jgi:RNA polymerase sigma-70 factor (ECF subfamily)
MDGERNQPAAENELVRRARAGDVEAFEALYRRHVDRVFGLCLRMTADRSRAEDLAQEAFVRAWRKLPTYRSGSAFGSWLHRLTVNVVLSDLRRRRVWDGAAQAELIEDDATTASPSPAPGARLDLERAIATLPPGARAVFVLYDVEGYQHGEIAALTGLAPGTSKAQLHRARKLLRKALQS